MDLTVVFTDNLPSSAKFIVALRPYSLNNMYFIWSDGSKIYVTDRFLDRYLIPSLDAGIYIFFNFTKRTEHMYHANLLLFLHTSLYLLKFIFSKSFTKIIAYFDLKQKIKNVDSILLDETRYMFKTMTAETAYILISNVSPGQRKRNEELFVFNQDAQMLVSFPDRYLSIENVPNFVAPTQIEKIAAVISEELTAQFSEIWDKITFFEQALLSPGARFRELMVLAKTILDFLYEKIPP